MSSGDDRLRLQANRDAVRVLVGLQEKISRLLEKGEELDAGTLKSLADAEIKIVGNLQKLGLLKVVTEVEEEEEEMSPEEADFWRKVK